jgi:hypothetical protein
MPALRFELNLEGAWPDLDPTVGVGRIRFQTTQDIVVGGLAGGMRSGQPSVMLRLNLPDGSVALGETSLGLFLQAADALRCVYGDPRATTTT